jgi:hypothetical protein
MSYIDARNGWDLTIKPDFVELALAREECQQDLAPPLALQITFSEQRGRSEDTP